MLVPSPKVATYDLKPEMSAYEVKDKLVGAIDTEKYDFIVVNYANGDMVGHTGIYPAIQKAVETLDNCLRDTVEAAKAHGYEVIIIADHGNADNATNADGTPNTYSLAQSRAFCLCDSRQERHDSQWHTCRRGPSILHILGMPQPAEMTGADLIKADNPFINTAAPVLPR